MEQYIGAGDCQQNDTGCFIHSDDCDGFGPKHNDRVMADLEAFLQEVENTPAQHDLTYFSAEAQATDSSISSEAASGQTTSLEDNDPIVIPGHSPAYHAATPTTMSSPEYEDHDRVLTPYIMRPVAVLRDATEVARAGLGIHQGAVNSALRTIDQRLETLACLMTGENGWTGTKQDLWQKAVKQTMGVQTRIEAHTGQFSREDQAYVDTAVDFEGRLRRVLHVGLVKQELLGGQHDLTEAKSGLDLNGSCLLEACKWQLEVLQNWQRKLADSIRAMGGLVF